MFGKLNDWRRILTRYDRCAHTFMSAFYIAAHHGCMRQTRAATVAIRRPRDLIPPLRQGGIAGLEGVNGRGSRSSLTGLRFRHTQ